MPLDLNRLNFAAVEFRKATVEDSTVKTNEPLATEFQLQTPFASESPAANLASHLLNLRKTNRGDWVVLVKEGMNFTIGETITLRHRRFGLLNGKNFIVKRIRRDLSGVYDQLTLFGPE
jgi:hypothetical protein